MTEKDAPVGQQPLNQNPVPEPSVFSLVMVGLLGLAGNLKRKQAN